MTNAGEPITTCPVCRYDLTGLPKNYTCPKCGFEYDDSMRIWWITGPSRRFLIIVGLLVLSYALVLVGTISLFISVLRGTLWIPPNTSRFFLVVVLCLIWVYFEIRSLFRHWRPFLIVGKDILHIRYFFWRKRLEWSDVFLAGREFTKLARAQCSLEMAPPVPKWKRLFIPDRIIDWMAPFRIVARHGNGSVSEFALPPFVVTTSARNDINLAIYTAWSKSRSTFPIPEVLTR